MTWLNWTYHFSFYVSVSNKAIFDAIVFLQNYIRNLTEAMRNRFWNTFAEDMIFCYGTRHKEYLLELTEMFDDSQLPSEIRIRLQTASPVESFDYIFSQADSAFVKDAFRDENPCIRNLSRWFFEAALNAKDLKAWLLECVVYVGNLVYGEKLFKD